MPHLRFIYADAPFERQAYDGCDAKANNKRIGALNENR
jgi:hypothetical protein